MHLEEGQPAPDFALDDADGKTWRLSDLRGQKVIVYFYPVDDTPGCTTQACDFRDAQAAFERAGYVTLGISPQGRDSKRKFIEKYQLNFPLLMDEDGSVARAYGVSAELGEYKGKPIRVKRSTFVVDEDGTLAEVQYGVRAKGHVASLLEGVATS
ncbi:MAG: thioredoxin-dependent peroxiredoxin [Actinomycetota bacterium]|nr:thioredoxin-dependent peroxiredoxin [Actinomycetota bacterium]